MYGNAKGWEPSRFRDNVLCVVAVNSAQVVAIYSLAGDLNTFYYPYFCLTSMPGVLIGVAAGRWASERIDAKQFKTVLLVMCSGLAAKLLLT